MPHFYIYDTPDAYVALCHTGSPINTNTIYNDIYFNLVGKNLIAKKRMIFISGEEQNNKKVPICAIVSPHDFQINDYVTIINNMINYTPYKTHFDVNYYTGSIIINRILIGENCRLINITNSYENFKIWFYNNFDVNNIQLFTSLAWDVTEIIKKVISVQPTCSNPEAKTDMDYHIQKTMQHLLNYKNKMENTGNINQRISHGCEPVIGYLPRENNITNITNDSNLDKSMESRHLIRKIVESHAEENMEQSEIERTRKRIKVEYKD
ncbi:MAG: hypothetical protein Terrestrivirus12_27 [Terrestrivirus sp.]|uniref:Uncharacterized protein n=1 Tax=Terrestrivirus sp. TaxID=2487775 RepID=A0A3G4ZQW6_9VIRU|nr:MAG: hypothetical protein Terrestrivirus12_27 [Terrestrivirus sp.]